MMSAGPSLALCMWLMRGLRRSPITSAAIPMAVALRGCWRGSIWLVLRLMATIVSGWETWSWNYEGSPVRTKGTSYNLHLSRLHQGKQKVVFPRTRSCCLSDR
ncbi:hypothetical protein QBC38DRAFT_477023 [Podospora fimiseda]|uniref:Uncharacterized protein n=1 Tax=Podospora fimiseda TaxID=252190 RepID=A0AAN7GVD3_9PEZI|nr:hypothetical protein QBC38DRAFT_477023 [Podospora fimiseda]